MLLRHMKEKYQNHLKKKKINKRLALGKKAIRENHCFSYKPWKSIVMYDSEKAKEMETC